MARAEDAPAAPYDPKPLMDKVAERIKTDKYRFAVLGDTKHSIYLPNLLKQLNEEIKPDFVLTTGDMVQSGGGKTGAGYWEMLSMDTGPDMRKVPWWPAIGNHEIAGGPITSIKELYDDEVLSENQKSGIANFKKFYNLEKEYYSFTFRNAVFIALPFKYPKGESEKWLEAELKKAKEAKKLIFIFNHAPFYTVGGKIDIPNEPTRITKMFNDYGVIAVFSGHDHGYYRTIREGIPYVISAGGGAHIYTALGLANALPDDVYYFGEPNAWRGKPLPEGVEVTKLKPLPLLIPQERLEKVRKEDRYKVGLELTADGTLRPMPPKELDLYLLHNGAAKKPDRITDMQDLFTVYVEVDGKNVKMTTISVRGEIFDELILSKE
jgi:hypothetical protein